MDATTKSKVDAHVVQAGAVGAFEHDVRGYIDVRRQDKQ